MKSYCVITRKADVKGVVIKSVCNDSVNFKGGVLYGFAKNSGCFMMYF